MSIINKKIKKSLNLSQTIVLVFLSIVVIGTILLSLPVVTNSGKSCGFITALFTATSAVCVTGLSLVDIWTTFNFWGQLVMLILMEIGGLGFMSIISILFYMTNHKSSVQSLSLMAEAIGSDGLGDISRIQKRLLVGSLSLEGAGAFILFFCFKSVCGGVEAAWFGIFHAVSSFCNAGFDLMGINTPGSSLITVNDNPVVLITLSVLVIVGGIGFVVWDDVYSKKSRDWMVYTKLVLSITGILLLFGTVMFLVMEYNNPYTFGSMSVGDKIVNAFFQSVTTRTAGFAAVNQGDLTDTSVALTILLMIVGGSAGSTAGGIKTVTFFILLASIFCFGTGRKHLIIKQRFISEHQFNYAYAVAGGFSLLSIIGAFIIDISSNVDFGAALFESVSALATVGLSVGITGSVSSLSRIVLILFMFIGRVGLLTITFGFIKPRDYSAVKYPSVKMIIG